MTRRRSAAPPAPHAPSGPPLVVWLLAVLVLAPLVWHGTLGGFFAQDDFAGLARASGALPRLRSKSPQSRKRPTTSLTTARSGPCVGS